MQTLIEWLQNETNYKRALVRLWCLVKEPDQNGNSIFDSGRRGYTPENHEKEKNKAKTWLETKRIPQDKLAIPAMQLAMLSALDDFLAETRRATKLSFHIAPVKADTHQEYWVIPRNPVGYLFKNCTTLDFFHRHHLIMESQTSWQSLNINFQIGQFQYGDHVISSEEKVLRLSIASFDDENDLQREQLGQSVFYTHTSDDNSRLAFAQNTILRAERENVHILLFPELTLSPKNQQAIIKWLKQRFRNHDASPLLLIGLGSFHESCKEDNQNLRRNRARVIYGRDARIIIEQDKFCPAAAVDNGSAINEDFVRGCRVNAVMTPLGLLGVAICKDLFDESTEWIWKQLSPKWLLVPSMSDKLNRHQEKTADLLKRHHCISAVANQHMTKEGRPAWGYLEMPKTKEKTTKNKITRIEATDYFHVFEIALEDLDY